MSMICNLLKVSSAQIEQMLGRPEMATELVYPQDGSYPEAPDALDLDKSWHLIHFLLTGTSWGGDGSLAAAILGGEALEETDAGYGPFRYILPGDVKTISVALDEVEAEKLWAKFDADEVAAAEIYPSPWTGGEEDQQYVVQNFNDLKSFYRETAAAGSGLLLYIS
jgi:hypothetical protein